MSNTFFVGLTLTDIDSSSCKDVSSVGCVDLDSGDDSSLVTLLPKTKARAYQVDRHLVR